MSLKTVKRLAARILGVGESRIKITDEKHASEALTADDVRKLLRENVLQIAQKKGVGRAKARFKQKRLHEGRRRGVGSRKGSKALRKEKWMKRVRALRKMLKTSRNSLKSREYRRLYLMIKGGFFASKRHLLAHQAKVNKNV